jgi:hypothetical protein
MIRHQSVSTRRIAVVTPIPLIVPSVRVMAIFQQLRTKTLCPRSMA